MLHGPRTQLPTMLVPRTQTGPPDEPELLDDVVVPPPLPKSRVSLEHAVSSAAAITSERHQSRLLLNLFVIMYLSSDTRPLRTTGGGAAFGVSRPARW